MFLQKSIIAERASQRMYLLPCLIFTPATDSPPRPFVNPKFSQNSSPLITYETGILGQAVVKKFFTATFLERKIMSTKTITKRIALVAASALAIAGFSAVPANAATNAYTVTLDAVGSTTTPVAGSAAVISVNLAGVTKTNDNITTTATTAVVTSKPTNSDVALTCAAITASAATSAITWGTNAAATNVITTTPTITATAQAAGVIGTFSFTPDTAGYYTITITPISTVVTAGTTDILGAATTPIVVGINVSGGSLVQAASGLGASTGTQVSGNQAAAAFHFPAESTAASRYEVTATGATIAGVFVGASQAAAVNANSYTAAGTVVKNDGTTFATGVTVPGAAVTTTGIALDGGSTTDGIIVQFNSATASTAIISVKSVNVTTGVKTSVAAVTVTFGAAAVVSATLSTAFIGQGNVCAGAANTVPITVAKTASVALAAGATTGATICVLAKSTTGADLIGQAVSVTIAGPGLISLATGVTGTNTTAGTTGTVRAASLTATTQAATNGSTVGISADGTAGTATITITVGGVALPTKTVLFFGSVATLTATQNLKIARSSATGAVLGTSDGTGLAANAVTTALTPAVVIVAKDSLGNLVPGLTISGLISKTTVISATTIAEAVGTILTTGAAGPGNYLASVTSAANGVSGETATVTYRIADPASTTGGFITAAPLTFSLGGSVAKTTISTDAASYNAGAPLIITLTSTDSSGNPVFDGAASTAVTGSKSFIGLPGASEYSGGIAVSAASLDKSSTFAPVLGGDAILRNTDSAGNTSSVTVAIESGDASSALALDAANAATDAANNAYDEAQNATQAASDALAAVTALAKQVKTLIASVKKLTAAVAKLK
jgi:trimeric autotransporter adhesin